MSENQHAAPTLDLAAGIVSAYVSRNSVPASELGKLIGDVHAVLAGIASGATAAPEPEHISLPTPAEIKKSIRPDALISFEDGKSYKTLKRHLNTRGLTPQAYRARYGLPNDYPMVCPNYSAQRSTLAKSNGLGRGGIPATEPPADDTLDVR